MAKKKIDFDKYAAGLFTRTEQYADKVRQHYATAVEELLKLTAKGDLGASGAFSFGDNTKLSEKANSVLRGLYSAVYNEIKGGVASEWEYANLACDALIESVFGKGLSEDNHFARWFSRNQQAMDSFFKRKSAYGGLNLSQNVWKYVGNLKTEMEVALTVSLGQGDSAATVSRKVRKYLNNPNDMFRRFRYKAGEDEDGNPIYGRKWKRKVIDPQTGTVTWENFNPRNYHPGQGVYRSSYKNAMRLTRTETNMAYRSAEQDRWQRMDFVVGYRVKRSKNHPAHDICDDLSAANDDNESKKGVYPKDFVFKGWHPQCRCFVVPILASNEEFIEMEKAILNGEEPPQPKGVVTSPNEHFNDWVKDNSERIENAKTLPYWVQDNRKTVSDIINSKADDKKTNVLGAVAKAVGVEAGKPMNFEQADSLHPNPHYEEGVQYRVNCQSAVVAYELRRRGLPVEAFGNVKGSMGSELAHHTPAAWVDADGKIPSRIACKYTIKERTIDKRGYVHNKYSSSEEVLDDFLSQTSEPGRYHVSWTWHGKNTGHIITMETFADGSRLFYDPQTGISAKTILQWAGKKMSRFDLQTRGLCALRVDNLQPNTLVVKGVVKKAGSAAFTPKASSEQLNWWNKNVASGKGGGINSINKKMLKKTQELRRDKERFKANEISEAKNLQTGKLKRHGVPRKNLINHLYSQEEVAAAEYAWNNPEVLRYVEKSELGAVKDMTKPEAQKNIEKKKERKVTHYNLYEFDYEGKTWNVKLEALEDGTEQFYCIVKTRSS